MDNSRIDIHTRLEELDFLRAVMIVLMVSFHLVWIGDNYPQAKAVVYTFHMPVFLIISGFLTNTYKPARTFLRRMLWLAVPYAVMESGYIVMASLLPIREHIDALTPAVFADRLLLHPLGPYWFLHTLMLSSTILYFSMRLPRISAASRFIAAGLALALCARLGICSLAMALYFLAGAAIRLSGADFTDVFRPSWLAAVALVPLILIPENRYPHTAGGILIVVLTICTLLAAFPYIRGGARRFILFLGRNTLPIFLFSPIFTILCKPLQPMLAFEPAGCCFLIASLFVCISGSLLIAYGMDRLGVSPWFCGRKMAN